MVVMATEMPYKQSKNEHCALARLHYKEMMSFIQVTHPPPSIKMVHKRSKTDHASLVVCEDKVNTEKLLLFPFSHNIDTRVDPCKTPEGLETLMSKFTDDAGVTQYVFVSPKPVHWIPNDSSATVFNPLLHDQSYGIMINTCGFIISIHLTEYMCNYQIISYDGLSCQSGLASFAHVAVGHHCNTGHVPRGVGVYSILECASSGSRFSR